MRRAAIAVLSLLAPWSSVPAGAAGAPGPTAEVGRDGRLALASLPPVLAGREVRPHLTTGLTTSFVLGVAVADASGHEARGGARIAVRYEPWDEVFHVQAAAAGGWRAQETLPSFDRLLAWWQGLKLPVAALAALRPGEPWRIKVRLDVVPFSLAEQRETQRWFTDSLDRGAGSPASGAGKGPPPGTPPSNTVLDLLIATSIKRRSLVGYDWTIELPPERTH
jgi:hypothetical protein